MPPNNPMTEGEALAVLPDYDAGLLNDYGGGNVEWWQDYLRAEIGRANDYWRENIVALTAHTAALREQPDHIVDATKMVAQQQGQAVAWQRSIEIRPGYWGEWAEYTDLYDEGRPEKVGRFNCRYRPLYTAPPSAPVGVEGLRQAIEILRKTEAALSRHFDNTCDGTEIKVALEARAFIAQQPAQAATGDADVRELLDAMDNGDDPRPAFIRLRKRYPPKATPPGDYAAGGGHG